VRDLIPVGLGALLVVGVCALIAAIVLTVDEVSRERGVRDEHRARIRCWSGGVLVFERAAIDPDYYAHSGALSITDDEWRGSISPGLGCLIEEED